MANNLDVTPGSGATVATDDVSGVHYHRIKFTDGTENSTTPVATGNGTEGNALRVTVATDCTGKVALTPSTGNGLSTYHVVSAASTNAANIKASAGQVYGWSIYNANASARKVVFHNTAGTPTAGVGVFFSVIVPGFGLAEVFSDVGITFGTGIGISMVTGAADNDATAVAANDLIANIWYL